MPDWLAVNNPRLRHIPIPKPDHIVRRALARKLMKTLKGAADTGTAALTKAEDALVDGTEGLLAVDIANIVQLWRSEEELAPTDAAEAVRRYKLGVTEEVWRRIGYYNPLIFIVTGTPHRQRASRLHWPKSSSARM